MLCDTIVWIVPACMTLPAPTPVHPPFHCVGCGACCKGRFIPLTLDEARHWLRRGYDVAVLLEAFEQGTWPQSAEAYAYNVRRATPVECGGQTLQVTAIFAGQAIPRCPNLREDDLCGIYAERPQVCRIYPMEINPFIELRTGDKDCPPPAWAPQGLLATDGDAELNRAIEHSRQADRADAARKVAACVALGLTTAAWKGNGLAIYFPAREALQGALDALDTPATVAATASWQVRAQAPELRTRLAGMGVALDDRETVDYLFHPV